MTHYQDGETVTAYCKDKCGFKEDFKYCEFGLNYFQTEGLCEQCGAPTVYEDGTPTAVVITFKINESPNP